MFSIFFECCTVVPEGRQFKQITADWWFNFGLTSPIYNKFIQDINQAITEFNAARTDDARKDALKKMEEAIRYVDLHAKPQYLSQALEFNQIKKELFPQIKAAYAENGIASMSKAGAPVIAQIISDMLPDKADTLMTILYKAQNNSNLLKDLYEIDDNNVEANHWRQFLQTHSVEFLDGANSKNFKVKNLTDGCVNILKVDNRLGMPRHIEQHLRERLGDVFLPIHADRQVTGAIKSSRFKVSRTLIVSDFCPFGSVYEHSIRMKENGEAAIFKSANDLMGQMVQIFLDIQKANCIFPDSKPTNWLVDADDKLRLADTKSFLFTQNGMYSENDPESEEEGIVITKKFDPPDMKNTTIIDDELHAFLLGLNIYVYLSGDLPNPIVFTAPIFQSELGQKYKELIESLTQDVSCRRMGLIAAQAKLQALGQMEMNLGPENLGKMREENEKFKARLHDIIPEKENKSKNTKSEPNEAQNYQKPD